MLCVGLDVHWRTSSVCILDDNGKKVKEQTLVGDWQKLLGFLATLPKPWSICFEASCGYGHLYDRLLPMAQKVVVAHPGALRLIFRSKRKNDRVDAAKLGKLLYLDTVPQVHVPAAEIRLTRIEQRLLRFFGLDGSQAPQFPAPSAPTSLGTPPDEPQPKMVISNLSLTCPP